MSPEAIAALAWLVRYMLVTTCGGFLVAHGLVKPEDLPDFANNAVTVGVSTALLVGSWIWGWHTRRKQSVIARVAAMPDVHSIHADAALADSIPSDKVRAP
jgi:hypothetical protein